VLREAVAAKMITVALAAGAAVTATAAEMVVDDAKLI
jgi:hypothetical protein